MTGDNKAGQGIHQQRFGPTPRAGDTTDTMEAKLGVNTRLNDGFGDFPCRKSTAAKLAANPGTSVEDRVGLHLLSRAFLRLQRWSSHRLLRLGEQNVPTIRTGLNGLAQVHP